MEELFVSILMILYLLGYLLKINDFLSLICCWVWLTSGRGRYISMRDLVMKPLSARWNLVFAYSDIWKFGDRYNFLLPQCSHLICRLRHLTLAARATIVKLELLREHTAIFARSLHIDLRWVLMCRSSSARRMKAVKALGPRLSQIYYDIGRSTWRYLRLPDIFFVVLRRSSWTLNFLHDLDQVLLRQMIGSVLPRVSLIFSLATIVVSVIAWRDVKAIIALLN